MVGPVYCRRRAQPETPGRGQSDHDPELGHVRRGARGKKEPERLKGKRAKDHITKMDGLYRKEYLGGGQPS